MFIDKRLKLIYFTMYSPLGVGGLRSEERRVGKECA